MTTISYIALIVVSILFSLNRLLYHLHMYQLNSYKLKRYGTFIKNAYKKIAPISYIAFLIWLAVLSIGFEFASSSIGKVFIGVWCATVSIKLYLSIVKKEKVKKPLVITTRVKRILVVSTLLQVTLILLAMMTNNPLLMVTLALTVTPITMICGNTLLYPFEEYLKSYYYKDAAKRLREHKELIIIGITGSYGKTSVKFILEKILSQHFNTLVTPHSYNTTLGVVITVRKFLNKSHEVFVAEMGAKQKGDIQEICELVQPTYGVITAVGPQHLETFGSLNTIIDTKFELAKAVETKGKCFVNGDSLNSVEGIKRYPNTSYSQYGTSENSDVQISQCSQSIHGSKFCITLKDGSSHQYETKLLGMHNILNIAGAIGVAYELGMTHEKIYTGVKELKAVEHRLELKKQGDLFILDDAFNSNPSGAKSALDVLNQFDSGKKIIMTPGMIELGSMDYEVHYTFGQQISEVCDYVILIGENKTAAIKKGLEDSGYNMENVAVMKSVYDGFNQIRQIASKGDIILIENDLPDNYNE
jgi:UDP-N-acetylmuramoyl-tripeptide--D-alanyl-D-alanine ligase